MGLYLCLLFSKNYVRSVAPHYPVLTVKCLLFQAIEKERARVRQVDKMMAMDERKRPYNSMYTDVEPTEEEMEAFRRKKLRSDDPMAQFLS